ncbi:hypothetical protein Tco_0895160 [Tanacetum coccineum]|uniref:Uncharacterized protein n=1 Tax=Tanacetum coccineum TaxID=301880 RepID=A0ABQ5CF04_9ASTR
MKQEGLKGKGPKSTIRDSSSWWSIFYKRWKISGRLVSWSLEVIKEKEYKLLYEEMARNLEALLQAELIEEERLARQKEEEANIALLES